MPKAKSKPRQPERLLTEVETELMNILWRLREGTVADVISELPSERKLAYTSVSTILRILEQKGVLKTRKEGRGHIYIPAIKKEDYEAKTVRHVVEKVFDGIPVALVRQLINAVDLSPEELDELKELIFQKGEER